MKNKFFPNEDISKNDLYFMCYMIERVSRKLKQKNEYVVNKIGRENLYNLISSAQTLHCENPLKVESEWIKEYNLKKGNFNISDVNKELCNEIPSATKIGKVYSRLINSVSKDYVEGIFEVYNSSICEKIDNYNCSAYYEPSYVIERAYRNGEF